MFGSRQVVEPFLKQWSRMPRATFGGVDTLLDAAHVKRGSKPGGPGKSDCQRYEEAATALPGRCRRQCADPENGPGQDCNAGSDARGGVLSWVVSWVCEYVVRWWEGDGPVENESCLLEPAGDTVKDGAE